MCCPSTDGHVFFRRTVFERIRYGRVRNVSASFVEVACRTSRGSCGRAIRRGTVFNCTRGRLTFLTGALFFARVTLYFARWCNGSTKDSGSFCRGSNPCRAARGGRLNKIASKIGAQGCGLISVTVDIFCFVTDSIFVSSAVLR